MTVGQISPDPGAEALHQVSRWLDAGQNRAVVEWHRGVSAGWLRDHPEVLVLVAAAAARMGDYARAVALATAAGGPLEQVNDEASLFRGYNVLGGVAFERGALGEAWDHYQRALTIARRLKQPILIGRVTMNQASIRHLRGEVWAAESLYRRALRWFESVDDQRGQAQVHQNLALVARGVGGVAEALGSATRAIALAERVGDPGLIGMAVACLAETELAAGRLDLEPSLARAGALAFEAGDALGQVEVERLRSAWYLAQGQTEQAVEAAEIARNRAKRLGSLVSRGDCAAAGADAWRAADQHLLAEARRDEAELLAELLGTVRPRRPQ